MGYGFGVVWERSEGAARVVEAAFGTPTYSNDLVSQWGSPVVLSAAGASAQHPRVTANSHGAATVVWERADGANKVVEAITRRFEDEHWQKPVALSPGGASAETPDVAVDSQGDAVAVWSRADGAGKVVEVSAYDAVGPMLSALSLPKGGVTDVPLSFSVIALPPWAGLGQTLWGFGDGFGASGTSVTHTYELPGSYDITVASADVLGNFTHASGTITVGVGPRPTIFNARLSRSRFRVAGRRTGALTTVSFTLSAFATVHMTITRSTAGLRSRGRCVKPNARLRRRHSKRCERMVRFGTLTRSREPVGADKVAFTGRIGSRLLPPGSYEAVLQATNAGGASKPVNLLFTIVRRP